MQKLGGQPCFLGTFADGIEWCDHFQSLFCLAGSSDLKSLSQQQLFFFSKHDCQCQHCCFEHLRQHVAHVTKNLEQKEDELLVLMFGTEQGLSLCKNNSTCFGCL